MAAVRKRAAQLSALMVALCLTAIPAGAGSMDIGGGWEASWDTTLDGDVIIDPCGVSGDTVFIAKTAVFTQGPASGIFPTIPIAFQQTAYPAASHIVIEEEEITNLTGVDWSDFHFVLLDHGDAVFDAASTDTSGGPAPIGWTLAPFTEGAFNGDLTRLDVSGGVVPAGDSWLPGAGASGGQLWISVTPDPVNFTFFTLRQTPTPEPGAFCLLALGACLSLLRQRSHRRGGKRGGSG